MTQQERLDQAVHDFLEVMGANGKTGVKAYKEKRVLDERRTGVIVEYYKAMLECSHSDSIYTVVQAAYRLGAAEARRESVSNAIRPV